MVLHFCEWNGMIQPALFCLSVLLKRSEENRAFWYVCVGGIGRREVRSLAEVVEESGEAAFCDHVALQTDVVLANSAPLP